MAQVAIGLLRQQLPPGDQVHGVVTESPGAANVIPGSITARYMVRSPTIEGLAALRPRVEACFEAGARATGCALDYEELSPVYSHMETDPAPAVRLPRQCGGAGPTLRADDAGTPPPTLSTDMANVSLAVPTIHPLIGIEAGRRRQPPARVRRRLRDGVGRRRTPRRCRRSGVDGHRRGHRPGAARPPPRPVITEHALLEVVPGRETEFVARHGEGEGPDRRESGLRFAPGRALSRTAELLPPPGRVGASRGPHGGVPRLICVRCNGGRRSTTSMTPSPSWSTSRPW